jgi:hypothetical protein
MATRISHTRRQSRMIHPSPALSVGFAVNDERTALTGKSKWGVQPEDDLVTAV